jgi:WD40 repeat protein
LLHEKESSLLNLVSVNKQLVSCSNDKTIKIWDLKTFECKETFFDTEPIKELIKLTNNYFLSFHKKDFIQLWDISQKICVKSYYSKEFIQFFHCVRLISGIRFARAHYNYIKIWELGENEELTLKGHKGWICDLVVLPEKIFNDLMLISCSFDKKIKIWNRQGNCSKTLKGHQRFISCLVLLENGKLASGSFDKLIKIWNIESGLCINNLRGHEKGLTCLERNVSGVLFSASFDGMIKIWNTDKGFCLLTLEGHLSPVRNLKIYKDLLISSDDKLIKFWNLERGECQKTLISHSDIINRIIIA